MHFQSRLRTILAAVLWSSVSLTLAEEPKALLEKHLNIRKLAIPPRLQWRDRDGYCGECSIQQAALFFGNYVSQFVCREIVDPDQEEDVLVQVNVDQVLDALKLEYEEFNTDDTPTPQYKPYLAWTKQHLSQEHPVMLTMYVQDHDCRDYDHIVLATGFRSNDSKSYHDDDMLLFNDMFESKTQVRSFQSLHDTRAMTGNGAREYLCIPSKYDFGCAITGVKDETGTLLPIRVAIDRDDEPDVVQRERPATLKLHVTIRDLKPGASYVLYRYDDYKNLPTRDYQQSQFKSAQEFIAYGPNCEFTEKCESNAAAFFRCVPAQVVASTSNRKK